MKNILLSSLFTLFLVNSLFASQTSDNSSTTSYKQAQLGSDNLSQQNNNQASFSNSYDDLMKKADEILDNQADTLDDSQRKVQHKSTSNYNKEIANDDKSLGNSLMFRDINNQGLYKSSAANNSSLANPIMKSIKVDAILGASTKYKQCLKLGTYGKAQWHTYCRPIKRPKGCTADLWRELSTMAVMYC